MRLWPRPYTRKQVSKLAKKRFTDLAPSVQLHKDWKSRVTNGMTWADYTRRFLQEIDNNPIAHLCIVYLRKKLQTTNVTLLCVEPGDDYRCHRYIVKALIEGRAYTPISE